MTTDIVDDFRYAADPVAWVREVQGKDPDPWQAALLSSRSRKILLNCCRQSGKSTSVGWRVAHRLRFFSNYFVVCTAPSDRQSRELFDKTRACLIRGGAFEEKPPKDNLHEIVLPNGSRLVCLPSDPDTIRGFSSVNELLADEAAMVQDEVFAAVEPMLMRSKGTLVLMSTPKGQRGHFYNMWLGGSGWERYEVTFRDVLEFGHFSMEDLESFKREHGEEMFKQEYECKFISTLESVFTVDQVKGAIADDVEAWSW